MIRKQPWFERQFPTGLPVDLFPVVVERVARGPLRKTRGTCWTSSRCGLRGWKTCWPGGRR